MDTNAEAIERIGELLGVVTARFGADDDEEQQWMADHCSPAAREVLVRLNVQALHLIDAIPADDGSDASVNIVGLSRATGIPKGTVSKTVQRLVSDAVVVRHRLPGNRKEVHLRLSPLGEEIQTAHRSLHEQMGDGLHSFLARYSTDELTVITKVLDDLARMPREGLRFRPDLLD